MLACALERAAAASSSSAALTASAPGITATTITIGSHQPLTGIAAPGYDEIAPASNAYFQYVNAHGGIFGRKIVYKYLNDQYNPTNTSTVVHQLVLQDNVYAIFNGLGTPDPPGRGAVPERREGARRVRRLRLRVLERAVDAGRTPSAGSSTTSARARSSAHYIEQHFTGKKIGYFYQDDEFGQDGVKGLD